MPPDKIEYVENKMGLIVFNATMMKKFIAGRMTIALVFFKLIHSFAPE